MLSVKHIRKHGDRHWLLDVDRKLIHHQRETLYYRVAAVLLLVILALSAYLYMHVIIETFNSFLDWIKVHPMKGAFCYIVVYGVSAVFMVPALFLSLGAGYIYASIYGATLGVPIAFVVDLVGATFGAVLSFWVSKFLFYEWIEQWTKNYPQFQIAQKLLKVNAIKVMLILRVIMPYHILNYLLGITNVTTYQYIMGCMGMVVPTFVTCCVGSTITKISELHEMHLSESFNILAFLRDNVLMGIVVIVVLGFVSYRIGKQAYAEFRRMSKELDSKV